MHVNHAASSGKCFLKFFTLEDLRHVVNISMVLTLKSRKKTNRAIPKKNWGTKVVRFGFLRLRKLSNLSVSPFLRPSVRHKLTQVFFVFFAHHTEKRKKKDDPRTFSFFRFFKERIFQRVHIAGRLQIEKPL